MKKALLVFSLFLIFTTLAFSQNWRTVNPKRTSFFLLGKEFYGLKADSILVVGTDTIYYPYSQFRNGSRFPGYDSSWIGYKIVIQKGGNDLYFNSNQDTIFFNTQARLNDNWTFYKTSNGDYFNATVSSVDYVDLGGESDSVKTVILQYKDNSGNNINHLFNNYQFRFSKNYGLVQTSSLFGFPLQKDTLKLIGVDSLFGVKNIKAREIFDFNPGDVFHYENYIQFLHRYSVYKDSVISRSYSINNDTVIYKVHRFEIDMDVMYPSAPPFSSSNHSDTVILKYLLNNSSDYPFLNTPPRDWYIYPLPDKIELSRYTFHDRTYYDTSIKNRITRSFLWDSNFEEFDTSAYGEGIGMIYTSKSGADDYYEFSQLVYYKKGNEVWGKPINFDSLRVLGNLSPINLDNDIFIAPNPFSEQTTVKITDPSFNHFELSVLDMAGTVLQNTYGTVNNPISIYKNNLGTGMYLLRITGDNGSVGCRKLIIH